MAPGEVRLSASTFELIWQYLRLGDLPTPLFVPPSEQRSTAGKVALEELGEQNLLTGRDELDEELAGLLRVIAAPSDEFYGWFVRPDGSAFTGLVGVRQRRAALAVVDGDRVYLADVAPKTPAQALVGIAPRRRPVPAKSITVPADEFALVPEPVGRHGEFSTSRGVLDGGMSGGLDQDVTRLRELVAEPDRGRAQLFVAVRDRGGRRRKSVRPIYYLDTDDGRWLIQFSKRQSSSRHGERWLTASSGSPEALIHALYDTRRELIGAG